MKQAKLEITFIPSSEANREIRELLRENGGKPFRHGGTVYLPQEDGLMAFPDTEEGARLERALTQTNAGAEILRGPEDAWRAALYGDNEEAKRMIIAGGGKDRAERCVILFRPAPQDQAAGSRSLFADFLPVEKQDHLISMSSGDYALVVHTAKHTEEDIREYTSAAIETMESEAGMQWIAGIGNPAESLGELHRSYREAQKALETKARFRIDDRVAVYRKLTLERVIDSIPEETARKIREEILDEKARKLMTEEILETIQVFFGNDLSMSATARQMFIHRNTLGYRLDKIRKATGLDLRKFRDAAVFLLIMEMDGDA